VDEQRLNEEKIETLGSWADGLLRDERSEVRAAAKAILLLIQEIEHLHVDLWHARDAAAADAAVDEKPVDDMPLVVEPPLQPDVQPSIRSALARRLRAAAQRPPEAG
jgi:hypothetical protein